jgi:hypothetical protein
VRDAGASDRDAATAASARPNETFGGGLPVFVNVQGANPVRDVNRLSSLMGTSLRAHRSTCAENQARSCPCCCAEVSRESAWAPTGRSRAGCSRRSIPPCRCGKRGSTSTSASCVDDLGAWTPNTYGLPPIKPLFDVYEQNLSLHRLMDQTVVAVGAGSGLMHGTIKAMSTAIDPWAGSTMSDFLIAPAT